MEGALENIKASSTYFQIITRDYKVRGEILTESKGSTQYSVRGVMTRSGGST